MTHATDRAARRGVAARAACLTAVAATLLAACSADPTGVLKDAPEAGDVASDRGDRAGAEPDAIPDAYIVSFVDSVSDPRGLTRALAAQQGAAVRFEYATVLKGFAARLPVRAVEALRRNPQVAAIEPDAVLRTADAQSNPPWGLDRLDQHALPLNRSYTYAFTGAGVTAYIVDTGIRFSHAEFEGRAQPGIDLISDGRAGNDCNGHGTHVAGTVGGRTWGVAKAVALVAVRVSDCNGVGSVGGAIAGLDWIARNRRLPAVANISLAAAPSESFNNAVRNLIASGVQVAIAAGNSNVDGCTYSPSATREAVVVGAAGTANINTRQPYSNWGPCVDLFAPGSQTRSAYHLADTSSEVMSGTSMAAPHAAGVMALWLQENPTLTPAQLHRMVLDNAAPNVVLDAQGTNPAMLQSVRLTSPPPAPPTATMSVLCAELTCTFDASSSSASDAPLSRYEWAFGDGGFSTEVRPTRSYAAAGSYTVTLTVIDAAGLTGRATRTVAVAGPARLSVSVSAYRAKRQNIVDLAWSGAVSTQVVIQRNGATVRTMPNTGTFTDYTGSTGRVEYRYRLCEAATSGACSAEVLAQFR